MRVFTFSQARQNFASLLDRAKKEGKALIRRKDGSVFVVQPVEDTSSPLDVPGVRVKLTLKDIVAAVREGRER